MPTLGVPALEVEGPGVGGRPTEFKHSQSRCGLKQPLHGVRRDVGMGVEAEEDVGEAGSVLALAQPIQPSLHYNMEIIREIVIVENIQGVQ